MASTCTQKQRKRSTLQQASNPFFSLFFWPPVTVQIFTAWFVRCTASNVTVGCHYWCWWGQECIVHNSHIKSNFAVSCHYWCWLGQEYILHNTCNVICQLLLLMLTGLSMHTTQHKHTMSLMRTGPRVHCTQYTHTMQSCCKLALLMLSTSYTNDTCNLIVSCQCWFWQDKECIQHRYMTYPAESCILNGVN